MSYWIYYHQLDPFLIQFTEHFGIRWYSLAYIAGVIAAYYLAFYFIKKGRLFFRESQVLDIVTYGAIGAVAGGRIGYCVFYAPNLLIDFDSSFPFWGLLKIHEGGMASHGGVLGLIISQWFYGRYHKISFASLLDLGALAGSVGMCLGRIANFINGELYGRVVENWSLLGVRFPEELFLWVEKIGQHKDNLLALQAVFPSLSRLTGTQLPSPERWESLIEKASNADQYKAQLYSVCNLIVEFASHPTVKLYLEPLLFVRHPSQFYQSFFGGLAPLVLILLLWLKQRPAGFIALVWAFAYFAGRFFTEFFRMPDTHIGYQLFNLTRGQWLSLLLLATITAVYFFAFHNKRAKI